jgi:hypothetical protein
MQTAAAVAGVVVVAALVGFFRSLWRRPNGGRSDRGEGAITGESVDTGFHGGNGSGDRSS